MRRWLTSLVTAGMIVAGVAGMNAPAHASNDGKQSGNESEATVPLPPEIWNLVFENCGESALINTLSVCHKWQSMASNPGLWSAEGLKSLTPAELKELGIYSCAVNNVALRNRASAERDRRAAEAAASDTQVRNYPSFCLYLEKRYALEMAGGKYS